MIARREVLGVPVDVVTMTSAMEFIHQYIHDPQTPTGVILAVNPEKVLALREDPALLDFFKKAALLVPDGIGVVKALRWRGEKAERVPGADLMQEICRQSVAMQYKIFIYGSSAQVNAASVEELRRRYPGIAIVGSQDGFLPEEQMPELLRRINEAQAQILFVALGSPRQELWMQRYGDQLTTVKLCQGIGGTLDTIAGHVKRAPLFWQKRGLEWLYRLLCQPSRIKRQKRLGKFVYLVLKENRRKKKAERVHPVAKDGNSTSSIARY